MRAFKTALRGMTLVVAISCLCGVWAHAQDPEVKTALVVKRPFKDVLSYPGRIMSGSTVNLRFSVSGFVKQFNFKPGDNIEAGQVVVELDPGDCQLQVKACRNNLLIAQNEQEKIKYQISKASGKETDRKELEFDLKRAELEVAAAAIDLEGAQMSLDKTRLYAPENVMLESRFVEPGEFVTAAQPVARLVEFDSFFVDFGIIEQQLDRIQPGQEIMVGVDSIPDAVFSGKVAMICRNIDPDSGKLIVRGRIDNSNNRLVPGMFADVDVVVFNKKQALLVPADSIFKIPQDGYGVWIVGKDNVLELRRVIVEYDKSIDVAVIGDGLEEGQRVVCGHVFDDFKPGMAVRLKD